MEQSAAFSPVCGSSSTNPTNGDTGQQSQQQQQPQQQQPQQQQQLPVWIETKTGDNKVYYYNAATKETTWKRPENVRILKYEDLMRQSAAKAGAAIVCAAIAVIKEQNAKKAIDEAKVQETSQQQQGEVSKVGTNNNDKKFDDSNTTTTQSSAETEGSQQQGAGSKQKEGMRPVSTTAVPGTPWCVVWTDKGRVFYFNPSTKTSVWERPPELRNREDVDKMVSNPKNQSVTNTNNDDDNSRISSTSDQASNQAEKKIKLDPNPSSSTANQTAVSKTVSSPKVVKKEVASEIEKEAAKKRETIAFEERVDIFRKMLEEKGVNPSSTFQRELSKIVFDARYLLLSSDERREVFEKYCLEKIEEERARRRKKIKKATDDFKTMLHEANLTSRSSYDEFHARFSKDPRYRALERSKDREILFDDHLALLRRKEREERSQSKRTDRRSVAKENFRQLLRETKLIDKDTRRKIEESEHQHLIDIIGTLQNDRRYVELEPYSEERRKILLSYIKELAAQGSPPKQSGRD